MRADRNDACRVWAGLSNRKRVPVLIPFMVYMYSRTMTGLDARTTAIILSVTKAGYGNG